MTEEDTKSRILGFAAQVGASDTPAEDVARRRGWLDDGGEPTEEGRQMIKDLDAQEGTRTVFR